MRGQVQNHRRFSLWDCSASVLRGRGEDMLRLCGGKSMFGFIHYIQNCSDLSGCAPCGAFGHFSSEFLFSGAVSYCHPPWPSSSTDSKVASNYLFDDTVFVQAETKNKIVIRCTQTACPPTLVSSRLTSNRVNFNHVDAPHVSFLGPRSDKVLVGVVLWNDLAIALADYRRRGTTLAVSRRSSNIRRPSSFLASKTNAGGHTFESIGSPDTAAAAAAAVGKLDKFDWEEASSEEECSIREEEGDGDGGSLWPGLTGVAKAVGERVGWFPRARLAEASLLQ